MADPTPKVPDPTPAPTPPEIAPIADVKPLDETIPGGKYMVNGFLVDANGNPIKA